MITEAGWWWQVTSSRLWDRTRKSCVIRNVIVESAGFSAHGVGMTVNTSSCWLATSYLEVTINVQTAKWWIRRKECEICSINCWQTSCLSIRQMSVRHTLRAGVFLAQFAIIRANYCLTWKIKSTCPKLKTCVEIWLAKSVAQVLGKLKSSGFLVSSIGC